MNPTPLYSAGAALGIAAVLATDPTSLALVGALLLLFAIVADAHRHHPKDPNR